MASECSRFVFFSACFVEEEEAEETPKKKKKKKKDKKAEAEAEEAKEEEEEAAVTEVGFVSCSWEKFSGAALGCWTFIVLTFVLPAVNRKEEKEEEKEGQGGGRWWLKEWRVYIF